MSENRDFNKLFLAKWDELKPKLGEDLDKAGTFFCSHCEEKKSYVKDFSFLYHVGDEKLTVCKDCSPTQKKKPDTNQINEQLLF
tara:strand:- start:1519 stop:1770 length:252 start_codon:yes stop_codon:yes gene_type:complete